MEIKVNVREIFYKNDKGFMIGIAKIKEATELKDMINKTITFTGDFPDLVKDNDYIFYGYVTEHPKYGFQFKVDGSEKQLPDNKNAIISFLSSGIFPKVGIRTATKIVEKFQENTLDKILENYQNLLLISNITEEKAKMIYQILLTEKNSYKVIINLQDLGFTFNASNKIYKFYKNDTNDVIESNIYKIVEDIEDIGFLTVDKIAMKQKIKKDDKRRIKSCVLFSIYDLCILKGDTYISIEDLYLKIMDYLDIDFDIQRLNELLIELVEEEKVVNDSSRYYLKSFYETEKNIAKKIKKLKSNNKTKLNKIDNYIEMLEKLFEIKYNKLQKEAIQKCLENNITIITGGPGTGKTTIIKAIVELYKNIFKLSDDKLLNDMALIAPTGRAAKRMKEATGFPSSTIHKFLKYNKEINEFTINSENKSDIKFLIIDEASMIDCFLFNNLLDGLKDDVKVVIVGDYNQLPSISPGQVLKDLITSKTIELIELNELYRQKEDSYIINLANEIKEGKLSNDFEKKKSDYNFIECSKSSIENIIVQVCEKAIERNFNYKDLQILVPMYKGLNGIDNLNKKLQNIFNKKSNDKREIIYNNTIFRENDKVLQTKNLSEYDVSNGDIGIIDYIGDELDNNKILIDFDGELVEYKKADLENVKLGYAISIHKAQGSEFDIVILPMDLSYSRMLYRKLIYTAVTRAKKSLTLIGEKQAFIDGIENIKEENRKTTLNEMLSNLI